MDGLWNKIRITDENDLKSLCNFHCVGGNEIAFYVDQKCHDKCMSEPHFRYRSQEKLTPSDILKDIGDSFHSLAELDTVSVL